MVYKVRVFRSNVKECLDAVERGEKVYIERGDRLFRIEVENAKVDDPLKDQMRFAWDIVPALV